MATFSLQWSPSPQGLSQVVQYKRHVDSSYTDYASVSPYTDSIQVTGLLDDTFYDFRIKATCIDTSIIYTDIDSNIYLTCPTVTIIEDDSILSLGYSFPNIGRDVDQYKVNLYKDGVIYQTDIYTPSFSSTISGTFSIAPGSIYTVEVIVYSTTFSKSCFQNEVFSPNCPDIVSMVGSVTDAGTVTINLVNFDFSQAPPSNQTVHISWRLESDPDVSGSYTSVADAIVNISGQIISPSPYNITSLPEASIVIKVSNDCGSSEFEKSFNVCSPVTGTSTITPQCATGYIISGDGLYCYKESVNDADCSLVITPNTACHYNSSVYNEFGSVFYKPNGYSQDGTYTITPTFLKTALAGGTYAGTVWGNPSANTTDGRLNKIGVWKCSDQNYVGTLGFSQLINLSQSKLYYVGFSADNFGTVKLNGQTIVSQNASNIASQLGGGVDLTFKYHHIYPVFLNSGVNYLEISGTNLGSIGIFGCEIYNATEAQLTACTTSTGTNGDQTLAATNLNRYIVFSSKDIVDNSSFTIGNCNCDAYPGSTLIYDSGSATYKCRQLSTLSPF